MFTALFITLPSLLCVLVRGEYDIHPHAQHCIEKARISTALESEIELMKLYEEYRVEHSVDHGEEETEMRRVIFKQNLKVIMALKKSSQITWQVGITPLAHLTADEVELTRGANFSSALLSSFTKEQPVLGAVATATEVDWRKLGGVAEVQNQLGGTCWAHAAVVPIEAQLAKLSYFLDNPEPLSSQELVDCTYKPDPKVERDLNTGGTDIDAWEYIKEYNHLSTRKDVKDEAYYNPRRCNSLRRFNDNALGNNRITGYKWISESALDQTIETISPVTTTMATKDAKGFSEYKGGDFDWRVSSCKEGSYHIMAIIGYTPTQYIVKNSHGVKWGDKGYMWFLRTAPAGFSCNFYQGLRYPVIEGDEDFQ